MVWSLKMTLFCINKVVILFFFPKFAKKEALEIWISRKKYVHIVFSFQRDWINVFLYIRTPMHFKVFFCVVISFYTPCLKISLKQVILYFIHLKCRENRESLSAFHAFLHFKLYSFVFEKPILRIVDSMIKVSS